MLKQGPMSSPESCPRGQVVEMALMGFNRMPIMQRQWTLRRNHEYTDLADNGARAYCYIINSPHRMDIWTMC